MFVRSPKLMLTCIAIGLFALTAQAQSQQELLTRQTDEMRKVFDNSFKTSIFENSQLTSFRVQSPDGVEKVVSVVQGDDKRSFTMFDEGRAIKVALEADGRVSSIVFPNGKKATFRWVPMPNGYWVPASIKVDEKDISSVNLEGGGCVAVCRQAAAAAAIAAGICYATGGISTACWTATATAAYLTYFCYDCIQSQNTLTLGSETLLSERPLSRVERHRRAWSVLTRPLVQQN